MRDWVVGLRYPQRVWKKLRGRNISRRTKKRGGRAEKVLGGGGKFVGGEGGGSKGRTPPGMFERWGTGVVEADGTRACSTTFCGPPMYE